MKRILFRRALSVLLVPMLLVVNPAAGWGWSSEAHKAIALIAMDRLHGTKTAARVQALLGTLTLDQIATCPDEVRDLEEYGAPLDAVCSKVFPTPPKGTASWHFIDIPIKDSSFQPTTADVNTACAGHCSILEIPNFLKVLAASKPSDKAAEKLTELQALFYVVHFIGDVHQPLHAADRDNDHGGNAELVTFFGQNVPLHAIWDNQIVYRVDKTPQALETDLAPEIKAAASESHESYAAWALESYALARDTAYKGIPSPNGKTPVATLSDDYQKAAAPIVRKQIARAGVRLARALETALP